LRTADTRRAKQDTSATCAQVSNSGSDAAYGRPSGPVPFTVAWMRLTRSAAASKARVGPKVETATNALVLRSRPIGSSRKAEC